MKHLIIILSILTVLNSHLFAQSNTDKVLSEIEKNNTRLIAMLKKADAEKIGNKTDVFLQNPEVELNYLWGRPSGIGNRTDISIKQTFDFPTTYSYRNRISKLKNEQTEPEYQQQKQSMLLQARLICIELIYTNALRSELSKRSANAQSIANAYKGKFESGETNILEYNKARLNLLNINKESESFDIERNALLAELVSLNGGQIVEFTDSIFDASTIPADFDQWYATAEQNNPILNWLKQEAEINQMQIKLRRADALPKFQAGYMSETVVGEQFQGISVGLSVPLWENKNKIKYAKANSVVTELTAADQKIRFYNHLKALHVKAVALQKNVTDYRSQLQSFDHSELLKKALDKGELSLIDYLLELSIYYESMNKLLESEKELNKLLAEFYQFM